MPTAPGFADCSIEMISSALIRPAYITFGVDPVDTDPQLVCASIVSAMTGSGSLQGMVDSQVTFRRVKCSLGIDGAEDVQGDLAISLPGLAVGASVTPNVALLLHKRTARGGRRGRGRMYLPWAVITSNVDEGGVITPATVTASQTKATQFLSALSVNTVPMVLLHNPGQSSAGPPNPVTSLQVDNRVGTQRRRLGR